MNVSDFFSLISMNDDSQQNEDRPNVRGHTFNNVNVEKLVRDIVLGANLDWDWTEAERHAVAILMWRAKYPGLEFLYNLVHFISSSFREVGFRDDDMLDLLAAYPDETEIAKCLASNAFCGRLSDLLREASREGGDS